MNVSNLAGRLESLSLAEDKDVSQTQSCAKTESQSTRIGGEEADVGLMSCDVWKSLYKRTAVINTARLTLSHPKFTEQEYALIERLNEAYRKKESGWTVLEIPENTPAHIMQNLLQITEVAGDYFTRTWFISEQSTGCLIGMMQTSALDKNGLSEVDRHLEQKYCGQGYGTEALTGIVEMYQSYKCKRMLTMPFSERKEKLIEQLKSLAQYYLKEDDVSRFLEAVDSVSEGTFIFSHSLIDKFPPSIRRILTVVLAPFSQCKRVDYFECKGLWAYASTAASAPSLKKCGFVKQGEDKWYCYC